MKVYIACRYAIQEEVERARELVTELKFRGHEITFEWTAIDPLPRPYLKYLAHNRPIAQSMVKAIAYCDVFILIWSEGLEGALIETGMAMMARELTFRAPPKIYIVADTRGSVFHGLPGVICLDHIPQLWRYL